MLGNPNLLLLFETAPTRLFGCSSTLETNRTSSALEKLEQLE